MVVPMARTIFDWPDVDHLANDSFDCHSVLMIEVAMPVRELGNTGGVDAKTFPITIQLIHKATERPLELRFRCTTGTNDN